MTILLGSYPKHTFSKVTWPCTSSNTTGFSTSATSSSLAKNSKTRSAAAAVLCNIFIDCEICEIGCVKLRVYVIND